ncbi:MAG: PaaI family thioesterase [Acidobacteriota bacterium]|nr:PaaI family thioesterase [Acidobacteriota bacterium]
MESCTHLGISPELCGAPVELSPGEATAALTPTPEMAADDRGLVHGGFVFGLADYAAMLAVNDPNVVLGAAECRFLAPVRVGEELTARAREEPSESAPSGGRKRQVEVTVQRGEDEVFQGRFTCFVLDHHVLDG